jgi:patatin-related protein
VDAHESPGSAAAGDGSPPHDDDVVELRLALVCYGGVSLAVYMHGITKELHKLVIASDALDHDHEPPSASTEAAYADLIGRLAAMPRRNGASAARTRVVIDIVAGTSAGGINGVCLARALARDASQDAIRDLWIEHADIGSLLQPGAPSLLYEAWPHVSRAWPGARDAIPAPDEEPVPAGEGLVDRLRRRLREEADDAGDVLRDLAALEDAPPSLLRGEVLSQRVYAALAAMPPRDGGRGTLMPAGHELELFVTATDLAGVAQRVLVTGQVVADTRHRHVLLFRRRDRDRDQFTDAHVPMLSFAARATSSFPAAFRPISLAAFAADIGEEGHVWGPQVEQFFRPYALDGLRAEEIANRWFVDGGVLDNKPFDHAVAASSTWSRTLARSPPPGRPARRRRCGRCTAPRRPSRSSSPSSSRCWSCAT